MPDTSEEPIEFFFDVNLGTPALLEVFRQAGAKTVVLTDMFPQDALDEEWMLEVGRLKLVLVTKDRQIRRRSNELAAIRAAGVGAFFLNAGNLNRDDTVAAFTKALPWMMRVVRNYARGDGYSFVATVSRSGEGKVVEGTRRSSIKRGR